MALSYRARRRWSLVILLVGLPIYIVVAVTIITSFEERPPFWLEALIYLVLGIVWALPFKSVFQGIGRGDPDAPPRE